MQGAKSHIGSITGLWLLPDQPLGLNTNEWMNKELGMLTLTVEHNYIVYNSKELGMLTLTVKHNYIVVFDCKC